MIQKEFEETFGVNIIYRQKPRGITKQSQEYYNAVKKNIGQPTRIYLLYVKKPTWNFFTYVQDANGDAVVLDGFSWGYSGEGPRGLEWLRQEIGFAQRDSLPDAHVEGAWLVLSNGEVRYCR